MKNLPIIKKAFDLAGKLAKQQVQAITLLSAETEYLEKIGYFLRDKPQQWLVPPIESGWYEQIAQDVAEVLPGLIDEESIFVVNSNYRWVLVKTKDQVLPFIFSDKGGSAHLLKIIVGEQSSWVPVFDELISQMMVTKSYGGEDFMFPAKEVAVSLANQPVRDPKWDATGVHW